MPQRYVLILDWIWDEFRKGQIARVAEMLDCKTPYELTTWSEFRNRWGAYDWDSPAFQRAILKRYRKICVYGSAGKEERELMDKLRPIYEKRAVSPPTPSPQA